MKLRHLVSINDLTRDEIETVFSRADLFLKELGDPENPHRIGESTDLCRGSVMATLFYEPSTRTRLSFESAMSRLGGNVISSADPAASSAAKGESLADTVRMASVYADVLVIRHPREGAAKLAAEYASVPVINGGDGAHEHPTQTLCDLFTIRRERGSLSNLTVALLGDLKGGRTVHSLVYALARFGATIVPMPANGLGLPEDVEWRLQHEFGYARLAREQLIGVDVRTTGAFVPKDGAQGLGAIDVLYVTRYQKERARDAAGDYPVVDTKFMESPAFRHTLVLHPLPRVTELDPKFDTDERAAYFRQASYGVPIRMALLSLILDRERGLERFENGFRPEPRQPINSPSVCPNGNCISIDPREHAATLRLFEISTERTRCLYCEHDVVGHH